MRVAMGTMIDVSKDFTLNNLTVSQKISATLGAMTRDSKLLSRRKKMEEERKLRVEGDKLEDFRVALLVIFQFYIKDNKFMAKFNQRAKYAEFIIDRENEARTREVLDGSEFNIYDWEFVKLDPDLVNSFGNSVPVILRVWSKEVSVG